MIESTSLSIESVQERSAFYPSLAGRTALITGGASGIGRDIAARFIREGSSVVVFDKDTSALDKLREEFASVIGINIDLADLKQVQETLTAVERDLGPLSFVINNCGDDTRHTIDDVTTQFWDECIAVNLKHIYFVSTMTRPSLRRSGGGSIVNFGSLTWRLGNPSLPVYSVSKIAAHGVTRALFREFALDKIRVNTVSPGWIITERQQRLHFRPDDERELMSRQAIKEILRGDDVANIVIWLCSDDSKRVTGQDFIIDGGLY
ncbi:MAG TPA: SDR family oxidoreductase [Candidatus Baltobacteraceae bacterium]|jgi:NAD(P)-dependent dehydrogenase (short-subunit alcohol dehydrogenase family)|nr:SDR family oxidoreductase [Candidatus Baltobacteraceae bacterium]